jgi:starch synthase
MFGISGINDLHPRVDHNHSGSKQTLHDSCLRKASDGIRTFVTGSGTPKSFRTLFLSSEIAPFSKTGGLADVAEALPVALKKGSPDDLDIRIATIAFPGIERRQDIVHQKTFSFRSPLGEYRADIYLGHSGRSIDIPVYFIGIGNLFGRHGGVYGDENGEYPDNFERFTLWTHAIFRWIEEESFYPDIVHGNDWQTGLFFPILRERRKREHAFSGTRSLFTIHNLSYKGLFPVSRLKDTGLPQEYAHFSMLEFYGNLSFLKGGIVAADAVTTVSPNYRNEILSEPAGEGLSGALRIRGDDFIGILNGIDAERWDPATDPFLRHHKKGRDPKWKWPVKKELMDQAGLGGAGTDRPLISMVTRLTPQKGVDIAFEAFGLMLQADAERFSVIVLGSGDSSLVKDGKRLAEAFPEKFAMFDLFDEKLAHSIFAGSDFFLMPSRFEPCGLSQMYSMRYGTLPIVNPTGGLKDTVIPGVNGLWLDELSPESILKSVREGLELYRDKARLGQMISNAMKAENGWENRSKAYLDLYRKLSKGMGIIAGGFA